MKNRKEIVDYILKLEEEFPVNSWTHNNIYLWPHLRIRLFLELIRQVESDKTASASSDADSPVLSQPGFFSSGLKKIFSLLDFLRWSFKLRKRKVLFVGADSHRVEKDGKKYNRFFDTLVDLHKLKDYWFLEYSDSVQENLQNEEHVIFLNKWFLKFLAVQKIKKLFNQKKEEDRFSLKGYDQFLIKLKENGQLERFSQNFSEARLRNNYAVKWNNYYRFYEFLLSKIKPERIFVLCYYDLTIMPLIAAANKKGISVIEMQHGPQADLHLAYGSWTKIPKDRYQTMPGLFWCWDAQSKKMIDKWATRHPGHKAIVGGHPWVEYWKSKNEKYGKSGFILYSLQPAPLSINQLFPTSVIEFIKKETHTWFLRLHPRQLEKKKEIEIFLNEKKILDLVNINEATNDPLPQLLTGCLLHATHFSGTAIEAALFDKHTVFFNQLGEEYYPDLFSNNRASLVNPSGIDFRNRLLEIIESHKN